MNNHLHKLAQFILDTRIIVGVFTTILGIAVWVTLGWVGLLNRVAAVEKDQTSIEILHSSISENVNEIKLQQATISTKIDDLNKRVDESNSLIKQILNLLK